MRINSVSEPILLADKTSVIITGRNLEDFCSESNLVPSHVIKLFVANSLVLNLDETNVLKFLTKNSVHPTLLLLLLLLLLVFSPWAGLGRDQSSVRRLVWFWYAASWASSLG